MKKTLLFFPLVVLLTVALFFVLPSKNADIVQPNEDWQGKPFPAFRLANLNEPNAILDNTNLPNEPFVVNVWASWCTWCIKEFPQLLELQAKGVKIVGLTYVDKPENARAALAKWGNPFSLVIDDSENDFFVQTLQINSAPRSYLVDHNGIIRYLQKGYDPDLDLVKEFERQLAELRKEM